MKMVQITAQEKISYELYNYYHGYDDKIEQETQRKNKLEKERLLSIPVKDWADTFDKFIEYMDEGEL